MRVALVTSTFLPSFVGGRENHVNELAKALVKRGFDVVIVTGDRVANVLCDQFDNVIVYRIPYIKEISFSNGIESVPYRIISPHLLFRVLRLIRPDIVHAHDIKHFTSDCAAMWCAISLTPFVLTVHGIYYKLSKAGRLLSLAHDLTLNLFTLRVAKKIIIVSKRLIKFPLTLFASKIVFIPNAIPSLEDGEEHHANFRMMYNIPSNSLLVVTVARITPQKGLDVLINAWKMLQRLRQGSKDVLAIIGPVQSRPYYEYLLKLAKDTNNVIFTGKIPVNVLRSAMREADIFVLPSRDEGLPIALLEAMLFGKPVIATSVGAVPSVLIDHVNGLLVKPNNAEELAKALYTLLSNCELRSRLSANARRTAMVLSWDNVVKYVIRVYEEVARR